MDTYIHVRFGIITVQRFETNILRNLIRFSQICRQIQMKSSDHVPCATEVFVLPYIHFIDHYRTGLVAYRNDLNDVNFGLVPAMGFPMDQMSIKLQRIIPHGLCE